MKTTLFAVSLFLYAIVSFAQINTQNPMTWMKGDNTIDQKGVYGTQGNTSISNKPGARNFSTTWKDNSGNLWFLGGSGFSATTSGYLNDLWKFDPSVNSWTWVKGDKTVNQTSTYGTQGVAANNNKPGAIYSGVSWTDANNNLWLFGGHGYNATALGFLNTLWKYNTTTSQWTWVKGDKTLNQVGVYGTIGIANTNNKPGARYGSQSWIDASGNLWLFGGYGYNGTTLGILNDIWKYNPTTNEWTWVKGDNAVEQIGSYGTKGVSSLTNKPGARYVSTSWLDANQNFWLFGGYGYDEVTSGNLNDIWKYNPVSNEWTWISGDKLVDQRANYGTLGSSNSTNRPGARYVSNSWKDADGKFLLFGGYGYDATNTGYLNDLWKYDPSTDMWTWVKGDNMVNQVGIYGTQGMSAPTNKSGARNGGLSWADGTGNLWFFGGYGYDGTNTGVLNDLWKINASQAVLPLHLLQFNGVLNNNIVKLKWQAEQETGFSHYAIQRSFDGINFDKTGTVPGAGNSGKNDYSFTDNELFNQQQQKVFYRLQMVDIDGKFSISKVLRFDLKKGDESFSFYPNPTTHSLMISFNQVKAGNATTIITDAKGMVVKMYTSFINTGRNSISEDVSALAAGAYILTIRTAEKTIQQQFIKR